MLRFLLLWGGGGDDRAAVGLLVQESDKMRSCFSVPSLQSQKRRPGCVAAVM